MKQIDRNDGRQQLFPKKTSPHRFFLIFIPTASMTLAAKTILCFLTPVNRKIFHI